MISIVIPTYKEAAVIEATIRRAVDALKATSEVFEIIVVDDSSPDGTAQIVEALGRELPVRLLRRPGRLGLATAVTDGWKIARGDVLGVMDADLQHPPEVLAHLAGALRNASTDLAIASRYVPGGGTADWSRFRLFVSRSGAHLASTILPGTAGSVRDSGSGMFLVRASALEGAHLNPLGFKMLLEVLAKARYREVVEVPYVFERRERGKSKLGARQSIEYLIHLSRLIVSTGHHAAWLLYGLVELVGAAVNVGAIVELVERAGWTFSRALPAGVLAAALATFIGHEWLTFHSPRFGGRNTDPFLRRLLPFEKVCLPGQIANALVAALLAGQGVAPVYAATGGVLVGELWNLAFNVPALWGVWLRRRSAAPAGPA